MPWMWDPVSYTWGYDLVGNRTLQVYMGRDLIPTTTIYNYSDADRLLSEKTYDGWVDPGNEISIINYQYDPNGNLTLKDDNGDVTVYQWDIDNRLIGVNNASANRTVSFEYCEECTSYYTSC